MDKILYFGYVLLTTIKHQDKLISFSKFYSKKYKRSSIYFLSMAYLYYLKYNIHPLDYFYYVVYDNKDFKSQQHANTLFMYRFHKSLNKNNYIKFFQNKTLFNTNFKEFIGREFIVLNNIKLSELKSWIKAKNPEFLIIKKNKSVGGFGVRRISIKIVNDDVFIDNERIDAKFNYLKRFDLIEEFVYQHEKIDKLNPSCLNTVRIVTVVDKAGSVDFIGAVIRLGVNKDIDNFHSGGIAVNIDIKTGRLSGEGFKLAPSDPSYYSNHPVTEVALNGYQLPNWELVLDIINKASLVLPEVRTVGWDVAITPNGVCLIEGNHDWDKIIIEKALQRGIRHDLVKYLSEGNT